MGDNMRVVRHPPPPQGPAAFLDYLPPPPPPLPPGSASGVVMSDRERNDTILLAQRWPSHDYKPLPGNEGKATIRRYVGETFTIYYYYDYYYY